MAILLTVVASTLYNCFVLQYLVFEYVEKTLLEVLEARRGGLGPEEVGELLQLSRGRHCLHLQHYDGGVIASLDSAIKFLTAGISSCEAELEMLLLWSHNQSHTAAARWMAAGARGSVQRTRGRVWLSCRCVSTSTS